MLVGALTAWLVGRGVEVPDGTLGEILTVLVSAIYYGLVRLAEARLGPIWGWLLGYPVAPSYGEYQPRHADAEVNANA